MKTMKKLLMMSLLCLAFIACSKDDDGGGGGGSVAEGTIKAKVDGTAFTSNSQFTIGNKVNAGGTTTVTLQGSDNSGNAIVMIISGFEDAGTYNIGGGANVFTNASYTQGGADSWQAPFDDTVAGEIKVSEVSDTNIKGTFEFTAKNSDDDSTKKITEGVFNIKLAQI